MKQLSLPQPAATLATLINPTTGFPFVRIVTSGRPPAYTGPVALHALGLDADVGEAARTILTGLGVEDLRDLPTHAVVGVADLVRCVRILDRDPHTAGYPGDDGDLVLVHVMWDGYTGPKLSTVVRYRDGLGLAWGFSRDPAWRGHLSDQLPFGDFTPGRWGWLLEHGRPLIEPVPALGNPRMRDIDGGVLLRVLAQLEEAKHAL